MENIPVNQEKTELELQRKNVALLHDEVAPFYDESFEGKAEYQIPRMLLETYQNTE